MWSYLKAHEALVRAALTRDMDAAALAELRAFHETQIRYLQHERLVHLLVMLFTLLSFLLVGGFAFAHESLAGLAAAGLLLLLGAAYVLHYFRLENGVQRLYHLANAIDTKRGVVDARYENTSTGIKD